MLLGLNHITIAVSDLERALVFYTELLGLKAHVRWDGGAYLSLGELWLCLANSGARPSQDYSHLALDIDPKHFSAFAARLRQAGVPEWQQNRSEGQSMYLLDPDGNKLEIHSGSLQSRLESLKNNPYAGLSWL